jgi:hypothetical protein
MEGSEAGSGSKRSKTSGTGTLFTAQNFKSVFSRIKDEFDHHIEADVLKYAFMS